MKALTYHGPEDVRYESVPDAVLADDRGAVVQVTAAGICGSDLHIYHGHGFTSDLGFTVGHEAVGEVVAIGAAVSRFKLGDRVLVPASTGCSACRRCITGDVSMCEDLTVGPGCYGLGAQLQGSQAEAVAVPRADWNLVHLPESISDRAAVVLSDNAPTAWYGAQRARVAPGDTVSVIGLGPVGLMAVQSAFVMGAARVFAIDRLPERRDRAEAMGAEPIAAEHASEQIRTLTGGRGSTCAIEAVGSDDTIQLALQLVGRRGRVSVIGVNQNTEFRFNMLLALINEIEFAIGVCSVQAHLPTLLALTESGRLTPEDVLSDTVDLATGPQAYRQFAARTGNVSKILLTP